ncbi:GNAT family N-acetyltransferase [Virgibacillus halodenitrificans]|uniref:GNAT family N-acetyltransferase n=1 Tax=Virgibacillus halodenitrificans TaxID=1482 RepID=UPI001F170488|nr:GNAT family N-acetyltransferase [Virgibacillus halodenitrificans]MCG1029536.1 GNAT family N-acetyltransferase [Virgibacillus halodenitrificans]
MQQPIQTLSRKNYEEIFALSQFAFQYKLSPEEMEKKKAEADRHTIWGWMEEDKIAAKLHLIPLSCYINGKEFPMGGISSVATWPEHRRKGMVKHLLHHALTEMKRNGQIISYLHPFSFAFYRRFGWEHAFTEQHFSIPIEKLKKRWETSGYVRRIKPDISLLHELYSKYAIKWNGMLVRDEKWWEQRVLKDDVHIAVAYEENAQAAGYIMYEVKENTVKVKELVHNSLNAQKLLLHFIGNHDSMAEKVTMIVPEDDHLPLLIDEPRFEQKVAPYFMARIVDVAAFLKTYPFTGEGEITLTVEDSFFPENTGTFEIKCVNGKTSVTRVEDQNLAQSANCSIQMLTGMLLGFKRPSDYFKAGLLTAADCEIEILERLIPAKQTFLTDFF